MREPIVSREAEIEACERAFSFLVDLGFQGPRIKYCLPESFRGGFVLYYVRGTSELQVRYLECEVEVKLDGKRVFGVGEHGSFAGNMFSSANLLRCIDRIALDVRASSGL